MAAKKASIRTHKGYFTRDRRLLDDIAAGEDIDKDMVRSIIKDLQARVGTIAELYEELVLEDVKVSEEQDQVMEELMIKLGEAARLGATILKRTDSTPRETHRPPQFRVANDLKPPVLTLESTPPEMRAWIDKFRAYFGASHMETLDICEQRAYFLAMIEGDLLLTMSGRIQSHHSIEDCIAILEERFLEIYPLFGRRLAWKQCKKKPSQKLIDYYHQLRRIGNEAELDKLTVEEHHMFELILACKHETELFLRLLEIANPTLEKVLATANAFEAAREIREQAVPRCQVDALVDCGVCGRAGHSRGGCPLRDIVCHECGRTGHLARVCRQRQKRNGSQDKLSRSRDSSQEGGSFGRGRRDSSRDLSRGRERVRAVTPNHRDRGERSLSPIGISAVIEAIGYIGKARPALFLDCFFDGGKHFQVEAIADTGATRTIIPIHLVPPEVVVTPSDTHLLAANGTTINNAGSVSITIRTKGGKSAKISAIVSSDIRGPMLVGWGDLLMLEVIPDSFPSVCGVNIGPNKFVDSIEKIREDFPDVLVDSLGECSGTIKGPEMHIEMDESIAVKPCKPR